MDQPFVIRPPSVLLVGDLHWFTRGVWVAYAAMERGDDLEEIPPPDSPSGEHRRHHNVVALILDMARAFLRTAGRPDTSFDIKPVDDLIECLLVWNSGDHAPAVSGRFLASFFKAEARLSLLVERMEDRERQARVRAELVMALMDRGLQSSKEIEPYLKLSPREAEASLEMIRTLPTPDARLALPSPASEPESSAIDPYEHIIPALERTPEMSLSEAATKLNISPKTLKERIGEGIYGAIKINRQSWRFDKRVVHD